MVKYQNWKKAVMGLCCLTLVAGNSVETLAGEKLLWVPVETQTQESQQVVNLAQQQQKQLTNVMAALPQNQEQKGMITLLLNMLQQQQQQQQKQQEMIDKLSSLLDKQQKEKTIPPTAVVEEKKQPVSALPNEAIVSITPIGINKKEPVPTPMPELPKEPEPLQIEDSAPPKPVYQPRVEIVPTEDIPIVKKDIRTLINENIQDAGDAIAKEAAINFVYSPGAIYRVTCQEGYVTDVQLQPGEELQGISGGDTTRWLITQSVSGGNGLPQTHVYIKPLTSGIQTNIIITTNKRSYQVLIKASNFYYPIIQWMYPETQNNTFYTAPTKKKERERDELSEGSGKKNYIYKITAKKDYPWTPLVAYDKGGKTYIIMPEEMKYYDAPVVMVKEGKKQLTMVNSRLREDMFIVDRLFDEAELRNGNEVVTIKRMKSRAE